MSGGIINGLIDIIYPKICLSCKNRIKAKTSNNHICEDCWVNIKRNLPPFCYSCGRHLEGKNIYKNICCNCLKTKLYFDRAFSPCIYVGVIKELIYQFKYKGKDYLGLPLSILLNDFIREYNLPIDYIDFIVPVPLYKSRLREREFNQAEVLAKFIAQEFKKQILTDALYRHRETKTQTDLDYPERFINVKGSFRLTNKVDIKDKCLFIVDDVLTTGATASEASLVLKEAGANIVFVLTLATA
jgi:ComF family protein